MFDKLISVTILEHAPLEAVYIYFDTATYDEIERDEKVVTHFLDCVPIKTFLGKLIKVTMEAQLGLIGGTMGLLTGFSILMELRSSTSSSGFLISLGKFLFCRFLMSLNTYGAEMVAAVKKRFINLTKRD